MTTSDDRPGHDDSELASTTHADPFADAGDPAYGDAAPAAAVAAPSAGRLVLAVLVGLAAALIGIAVWSYVYVWREQEYVGVSVVIGLAVGYLLRIVSGRSTMPVRIIAVLITAAACVAGTVVAEIAYSADQLGVGFGDIFSDYAGRWQEILGRRPTLTWGIFAAAVVLAYLSAMPQKPSKKKQAAAPAAATVDDGTARDDEAPPPHLPAD